MGARGAWTVATCPIGWDVPVLVTEGCSFLRDPAPPSPPLRPAQAGWRLRDRPRSHLLCPEAAQVVALADQGFAFLEQVVGDRGARVQGLEALAQLVQLRADVQEHEQNAPVRGVVAVMVRVALYLQGPREGSSGSVT